jgi:hypothetical protein
LIGRETFLRVAMRDDRGIAMVTAILVMMVVTSLSVAAVSMSSHELNSSGIDRSRVQSVNAAEAGIDRMYQYVETTPINSLPCANPFSTPQTLSVSPPASYTISATYYDASQNVLPCSVTVPSDAKGMVIKAVGVEGRATRTMESFVRLTHGASGSFGPYAIYAGSILTASGQSNVIGNPPGTNNGDVYSIDALKLSGGGTIAGNVFTRKTLDLGGGTLVNRDALAKQAITMNGGAKITGSATSSAASVSLTGSGTQIVGDAYACTAMPSVNSGATIGGAKHYPVCPIPASPDAVAFPGYVYDPANWTAKGYTIQSFGGSGNTPCNNAETWIDNNLVTPYATTGNYVIRISGSTCQLTVNGGKNVKLRGDLAILSDGSLALSGGSTFSSGDNAPHTLHLMFGLGGAGSCNDGISFSGGTTMDPLLDVLIYTPCWVKVTGGALVMKGQILAGNSVDFGGGTSLTYDGISVPGLSSGYFYQDIVYIREIR